MKTKILLISFLALTINALAQVSNFRSATGCADVTTGLVAKYDFTGNANDGSGNANNGSVNGATLTADRFGNPNAAYLFNGTTNFIDVPHSSSLTFVTNKISVSYWVKFNSFQSSGSQEVLMCKQSSFGASQAGFNIYQDANTSNNMAVSNSSTFGWVIQPYTFLSQYHHVVNVYDNGDAYSYLDGVLTNTLTGQTGTIGANTNNLVIGKPSWTYPNAFPFDGVLDDIRIYNRPLTACDVDSLFIMPNPATVGVYENGEAFGLTAYPNPANSSITVLLVSNENKNISIQLYDILGKLILENNSQIFVGENNIAMNLSEVKSGIYFLRVNNSTQKIQIIK